MSTEAPMFKARVDPLDREVVYPHQGDFEKICRELFEDDDYQFEATTDSPLIIDGGAHVGLATLLFKKRHPGARIFAFEPDPVNIQYLRQNIEGRVEGVTIVNKALAAAEGAGTIFREVDGDDPSTWGNSIHENMWGEIEHGAPAPIETTRLSSFLTEEVAFLKLDIEGAEETVLTEIADHLELVRQMEIEFHGTQTSGHFNNLGRIVELLVRAGFAVDVRPKDVSAIVPEHCLERAAPEFAQIRARRLS